MTHLGKSLSLDLDWYIYIPSGLFVTHRLLWRTRLPSILELVYINAPTDGQVILTKIYFNLNDTYRIVPKNLRRLDRNAAHRLSQPLHCHNPRLRPLAQSRAVQVRYHAHRP